MEGREDQGGSNAPTANRRQAPTIKANAGGGVCESSRSMKQ
jgi:hypothetical protein